MRYVEDILNSREYENLRKTQKQALGEGLLESKNNLLIAETGNGKTLCSEILMKKNLEETSEDIVYCVPSRQLVRDKKIEFSDWYDGNISSGYINSRINVLTFESFYYNLIRGNVNNIGLVVLDDFHEIYSSYRGVGIEKIITLCKTKDIPLLCMSATIGSPEEIASWMDANLIMSEEERGIDIEEKFVDYEGSSKSKEIANFVDNNSSKSPLLVFNSSRSNAVARAREISKECEFSSSFDFTKELEDMMGEDMTDNLYSLAEYMSGGVGFHHAGLPSEVKEFVEKKFEKGDINVLCSTTTIAYGFDAPVQSVIVADLKRYNSNLGYMDFVSVWEYLQWIGRAARPGRGFEKGYSFAFCKNEQEAKDRFSEENRELEPIESHIEKDEEFRRFMIDLISFGWDTPEEILKVLNSTFYSKSISFGDDLGDFMRTEEEEIVKTKMKNTISWLKNKRFISVKHSSSSFNTTELGDAAVNFMMENYIDTALSNIDSIYKWIESKDDIKRHELLEKICREFDISFGIESVDNDVVEIINKYDRVDCYSVTSYILFSKWAENCSLKEISEEYEEDFSFLPSVSFRVSEIIKSTKHLFEVEGYVPEWIKDFPYRIKHGVKKEQVTLVNNIDQLGRKRVKDLDDYINSVAVSNKIEYENLLEGIYKLCEEFGYDEWEDTMSNNIDGIGNSISSEIVEFARDYH